MREPFTLGSAPVLESVAAKIYDSFRLHSHEPIYHRRLFVDTYGKTAREISPHLLNAQLAAPRVMVVRDFRLVYQPEEDRAGKLYQPKLRHDVERLKSALAVKLVLGERVYWDGPAALLPLNLNATPLTIPHGLQFYVGVDQDGFIDLNYSWRIYAQLRGELGLEL